MKACNNNIKHKSQVHFSETNYIPCHFAKIYYDKHTHFSTSLPRYTHKAYLKRPKYVTLPQTLKLYKSSPWDDCFILQIWVIHDESRQLISSQI